MPALLVLILLAVADPVRADPGAGAPGAPGGETEPARWPSLPLRRDADNSSGALGVLPAALSALGAAGVGWALWRKSAGPSGTAVSWAGNWRRSWRLLSAPPRGGLRVLQSAALTPQASLHVVQWDGREWLIGCTPHSIQELGRGAPAADDTPAGGAGEENAA